MKMHRKNESCFYYIRQVKPNVKNKECNHRQLSDVEMQINEE